MICIITATHQEKEDEFCIRRTLHKAGKPSYQQHKSCIQASPELRLTTRVVTCNKVLKFPNIRRALSR